MKMRGHYLRDWVKIKAYYYLDWMSQRTTTPVSWRNRTRHKQQLQFAENLVKKMEPAWLGIHQRS